MGTLPFDGGAYAIERMEHLATPRLIVYREKVDRNIAAMRRLLESVAPGSGFRHLACHAKTHKSEWVTGLLLERGIDQFKCTLHELDMLLDAGAKDILVAYPLVARDADRVAEAVGRHPGVRITAQIASAAHAERLASAGRRHKVELECLIDLDVGMHRTGIAPERAPALARAVLDSHVMASLRIRGLHAYDGHNNSPDPAARRACSRQAMQAVVDCARACQREGVPMERIVVGGSLGFLPDLEQLLVHHRVDARVEASPGTWIYWDTNYEAKMPGVFEYAALILAQVMDRPAENLVTLNLGHKRWAIDQGPVQVFSFPGLEVVSTSEEHTVLLCPDGVRLEIEDRVLIVPRHVCSTVNLWESFALVGSGGRVEAGALPVTARNR